MRYLLAIIGEEGGWEDRSPEEVREAMGRWAAFDEKVVGDGVKYREEGVFDKTTRRYRMDVVPNKLSDKLSVKCEMVLEAGSNGTCKRIFTCRVEAKIFAVGSILEKRLLEDMEKSQNVTADFTNRYIAEKALA